MAYHRLLEQKFLWRAESCSGSVCVYDIYVNKLHIRYRKKSGLKFEKYNIKQKNNYIDLLICEDNKRIISVSSNNGQLYEAIVCSRTVRYCTMAALG